MTPYEELSRTGRIGPRGVELLYVTVWRVAVANNFPPPGDQSGWGQDAIAEIAHDFVGDDRGPKRLLDLTVRSVDDASFKRLLEAAVLNFLRDKARATDFGKLVLRVKEILRDELEFELVPGRPNRWTVSGGRREPSAVEASTLAAATKGIDVVVPKWTSERRHPPLADRPSFVRLMVSVLTTADGSLTAVDIAHALTARLDHRHTPTSIELDVRERIAETYTDTTDPGASTSARLHATDIFNALSDRERLIVRTLENTVRDVAAMIGVGKSQAALLRQQLIERLQVELADDDQAEATATFLFELCDSWVAERTTLDGATSDD